jgi:hypothetical protein
VLTTLESSRFQAEALYSDKRGDWLHNMGVTLRPSATASFISERMTLATAAS